jgi:integrase
MGDMPLAKINRASLRQFSDLIAKIPDERHNVRRKFQCPRADFNELISLAKLHTLPCLTINAQYRLLDGFSEIFEWAVVEGMMEKNPATGLGSGVVRNSGQPLIKQQDQRDPLSKADLNQVFSAEWFANGTGKRTAKGKFYSYRAHYFWLPLLALFNGGRLNELSQLYLNDIKVIEGFACIDFNLMSQDKLDIDEPGTPSAIAKDKSLKTINAVRIVPIHQKLLDLGFLQYVDALHKDGQTRLFPELKYDKTKGYGRAAGKWFNERYLGIELQIERNGRKTFHSMRHNFATALGGTDAEANIKSDFMGHARTGSQSEIRYDKGILEKLKQNVDRITYNLPPISPFNVIDGLQSVSDALGLKDRHLGHRKTL